MLAMKPNILILGAGYGGMVTAAKITKELGPNEANITLVSKHDYHYQTTWLHEPAAGTLDSDRTRMPVSQLIGGKKIDFVLGEVEQVHPEENKVSLSNGE